MRRSTDDVETKALSNVISSPCEAEAQTVVGLFEKFCKSPAAGAIASAVFHSKKDILAVNHKI